MSYTEKDLRDEIVRRLDELVEAGDTINPDWMALAVIRDHVPNFTRENDFVAIAVWGHVRKMVGAVVRHWNGPGFSDKSGQIPLPGFELLQTYYEVERADGATRRMVRVHRMKLSTAERRLIAEQNRQVGQTRIDHGNQMDRETDELIAAGLLPPDQE